MQYNRRKNKFPLLRDTFDEFSFEELKDELEEILSNSDITASHLQHENIGPCIIQAYKKLRSENLNTDGYIKILMGYARFAFRDVESYLRSVVGLDEDDFQLIFKENKSGFFIYEKNTKDLRNRR